MNITKLAIIGITVVAAWFIFSNEKYEPISHSGEVFEHIETINENNARTIFYTPNGVALEESPKFIELLQVTDPDITEARLKGFRQHILRTMSLKAIDGYKNRYFGMFRNEGFMYGLEKNNVFIIYFVAGGSSNDNTKRREANLVIDALDNISLTHLN